MKTLLYFSIILFFFNVSAKVYIIEDTASVEIIDKIELTDGSEFSVISIIGHWKDNLGSFGSNKCYGTLEKKNDITLFLETVCEKESTKGKIITRGGRKKSLQEAGIGSIKIIDATKIYKDLINLECKYAVSYFKNHIQYTTKCNIDDYVFKKILNNL